MPTGKCVSACESRVCGTECGERALKDGAEAGSLSAKVSSTLNLRAFGLVGPKRAGGEIALT